VTPVIISSRPNCPDLLSSGVLLSFYHRKGTVSFRKYYSDLQTHLYKLPRAHVQDVSLSNISVGGSFVNCLDKYLVEQMPLVSAVVDVDPMASPCASSSSSSSSVTSDDEDDDPSSEICEPSEASNGRAMTSTDDLVDSDVVDGEYTEPSEHQDNGPSEDV
jgi:hypothetical protein